MRDCQLCHSAGGTLIWQDERCRVVRVEGAEGTSFPGYCRVIWHEHVSELTDLAAAARDHLLRVVCAVETGVRQLSAPDKINLAALGNMVPHLHWHVIPRWRDDSHFPASIWSAPARQAPSRPLPTDDALRSAIAAQLGATEDAK